MKAVPCKPHLSGEPNQLLIKVIDGVAIMRRDVGYGCNVSDE
jgi:hypothetical protein